MIRRIFIKPINVKRTDKEVFQTMLANASNGICKLTQPQLAGLIGVHYNTIYAATLRLEQLGKLERLGKRGRQYYRIIA